VRRDLRKLLYPKTIAVVGASRSEQKLGYIVVKNIIDGGFKGKLYPINPNAEEIINLKCFPDYKSLPETPELAIIALPSDLVLDSVKEINEKGTKNIVVFASGFKETGEDGKKLEQKLAYFCAENKINLLGPNCLGFVNNLVDINATFGQVVKNVGNLRFISQSGAIATSIFDYAQYTGLGFSEFITLGNKANISENDVLDFWKNVNETSDFRLQPSASKKPKLSLSELKISAGKEYFLRDKHLSKVRPIGMYLESIDDGEDFINIVSQITMKDPVFILKPGKSKAAKVAMQSHTGSIAGEDYVMDMAFKQAGVIRCEGIEDLFDLSRAFSWENAPEGPNVAIVSNAGGPAVISADFVEAEGLQLAQMTETTRKILAKHLPRAASFKNPIDVLGDALAERYYTAIDTVLGQRDVHSMVVILTPQVMTEIYNTAELIGRLSEIHKKPVVCAFMGGSNIEKGERILNLYKIPTFRYPERAIKALGKMWQWKKNTLMRSLEIRKFTHFSNSLDKIAPETNKVRQIVEIAKKNQQLTINKQQNKISSIKFQISNKAKLKSDISYLKSDTSVVLNPFQTNEILKSWYINTPPADVIYDVDDGVAFAHKHGWPVVLKLASNNILHKSDLGGVIVNIKSVAEMESALDKLSSRIANLDPEIRETIAVQIQKQIIGGMEIILGVKKDPNFGHVMMFGAGGTLAEIIQDRNLRLLPVDRFDGAKMVLESKVSKILNGYRGEKPFALSKLYLVMEKLSDLIEMFPEFDEFEINPLIITYDDIWAVDGKGIINN
jgi:acyl-CoA synthetase (NDP forming)